MTKKKAWQKRNPFALLSSGSFLEVSKKRAKTHRTLLNSKLSQSYLRKILPRNAELKL